MMTEENIQMNVMGNVPDGAAVPISRALHVTTGPPVVARVLPVAAPVSRGALPALLAGLCCLGLILFLIAATIILSLIPIYTPTRNNEPITQTTATSVDNQIANDTILDVGDLNGQQRSVLQNGLQNVLNSNPLTSDATVSVIASTALANTRAAKAKFVRSHIIITYHRGGRYLKLVLAALSSYVISADTANQLVQLATPTTTTTTTTVPPTTTTTVRTTTANTTAGNTTRAVGRRSLIEGGAPAGIVYVDSHQMASVKGNVSSVTFYVDQTCATATVEFAAFELIGRDVEMNTATLVLKARSGELKVPTEQHLKPQMAQITIRLCTGDAVHDVTNGDCQGHQFPVLAHQYLGIRSDTCRLGYADPPSDPALATTWKVADSKDPFAIPRQKISYVPSDYIVLHSVTIESIASSQYNAAAERSLGSASVPRVLFIGSFPPRRCGLATFLGDVAENYPGPYGVVAVDESTADVSARTYPEKVIYRLNQNDRDAYYSVAEMANSEAYDVVNIQHEYALYGGMLGEYVIGMIGAIRKPVIVTMHTIISDPNSYYRSVTRALCSTSARVIVLSNQGRDLLINAYGVEPEKVVVVPHGVPDVGFSLSLLSAKKKLGYAADTPIVATFGLLHRNKNIQLSLKAMAQVVEEVPKALYLVIGQTHPGIQITEGELYRHELESNVTTLGLEKNVKFINKYVTDSELLDYMAATDLYVTPYVREDQYASGTLSWAVGVGKAVISTPFWYAKELLADGRGFLVPFNDDHALSRSIVDLLQDDEKRNSARALAYAYGRHMTWPSVGKQLQQLFSKLVAAA